VSRLATVRAPFAVELIATRQTSYFGRWCCRRLLKKCVRV
jgi:hypothetical protein